MTEGQHSAAGLGGSAAGPAASAPLRSVPGAPAGLPGTAAGSPASPWGDPPAFWPPTPVQRAALSDLYRRVDATLADWFRACRACGKCCRFSAGGIILFASGLEMAHLVSEVGPPVPECLGRGTSGAQLPGIAADAGMPRKPAGGPPAGATCGHAATGPDASWQCPYQEGDLCGARDARPLGCRTYFCDDEARAVGERLHAKVLSEIGQIAEAGGAKWWYGPARVCLEAWSGG